MARPRLASASPRFPDPSAWPAFLLSQVARARCGPIRGLAGPARAQAAARGHPAGSRSSRGPQPAGSGRGVGTFPSRLVGLLDEMEGRGLVERRDRPGDRRSYSLHLTDAGREAMEQIVRAARQHEDDLCAALDESEREQLVGYLRRIAEQQGLAPGFHPGWKPLGEGRSGNS